MMHIPKEIFRAYDIRGIVDETLTTEVVQEIGRALGSMVLENGEDQLVVGRDGRLSGPKLLEALKAGVLSTGCHWMDIGLVPTPVLYFATHFLNIRSGVVITGSHNPKEYNGLKIMLSGKAIYGEEVLAIYQRICAKNYLIGQGMERTRSVQEDYIHYITEDVLLDRPLKIVVDCGNGAAGMIAPRLYQAMGCEVIPLYCEIDGNFPNHHPDPGQPKNLKDLIATVQTYDADLGLAFDGDGDRLGVVDSRGKIIWPDRLLILFAQDILKSHQGAEFIFDVKCSRHVEKEIAQHHGRACMWKTGHSFIKAKMKESGALLAGEMSGHIFFKDRWFGFDDGLYSGARLLEILAKRDEKSAEVFKELPESVSTPEIILGVAEEEKFIIVEKLIQEVRVENAKISTLDGLRIDFDDGFGLVRPSNTGPNLILRFEGDTQPALDRIQALFRKLLLMIDPKLVIP